MPARGFPVFPAKLAATAAVVVGVVAIPVLNVLPAPVTLCTFRPPFDCIAARLTGSQYVAGEGPTALAWLILSLVVAPVASFAGASLVERDQTQVGKLVAAAALAPNLLPFVGTYAVLPFHHAVFALTLATLVVLLQARATN